MAQDLWAQLPPFASLDVDADGHLSADEVRSAYMGLFPLDADGDGVLSATEKEAADLAVDALLRSRDRDGDGRISRAEYEAHW
jgi:Ca2+-binding EF-hand superfamily protein